MRAAVYEELGRPSVLHVKELPDPHPASGEVRVRVRVSGVNPTDWKSRSAGPGKQMPYDYVVPDQDGAGEIDEIGEGVDPRRLGERVWVYLAQKDSPHGTAAQWTCVPDDRAVTLPDGVSFEMGASLGVPALTARYALLSDGPVARRTVLVTGGAGAVGHFAIELAVRAGARVITTVSNEEKAKLAREAGAHVVVNYKEEDVVETVRDAAPDGVARVVEVAPSNLAIDAQILSAHGTVMLYASTDTDPTLPVRSYMNVNGTIRCMLIYGVSDEDLREAVTDVSAALAEGALSPLPFVRFSLDQIAEAHAAVEKGVLGKVIVGVS